ncbi:cupin domain-containing protein [Halomarina pelagica]|uniref:cupin domain-containing protein n=1 Tax=Halomarina pelagica TaxID=2961599 RepID=UPI0020C20FC0|nr:cupin domain-containing protein [Halomarina sp. BND7]
MDVVSLAEKFDRIEEYWSPAIVGELNGQHVKLAKLRGEFDWHHHAVDELFLVIDGDLTIKFRDEPDAALSAGEFLVVPAGVDHRPVAEDEVRVLLFEPAGTRNTGNVESERTVESPDRL